MGDQSGSGAAKQRLGRLLGRLREAWWMGTGKRKTMFVAALAVAAAAAAGSTAGVPIAQAPAERISAPWLATAELAAGIPAAAAAPRPLDLFARQLALASLHPLSPARAPDLAPEELDEVVQRTCAGCHSDQRRSGNLSLEGFQLASVSERPETVEKMIVKLRAGMMPPPGVRAPGGDTLLTLVQTLERRADEAAAANPNPGGRTFQRLNRAEYERAVQELLGLQIHAGDYLPLDTKSANFDNIADVQLLSPTLLDAYLKAAAEISRLALGNPDATPSATTYTVPSYASQWERVEGAPMGTRGGISVVHVFPVDGEYVFGFSFPHTTTGGLSGGITRFEQLELSIDGVRIALLEMDQWLHTQDPNGVNMTTEPIRVQAGPQRVTAAFVKRAEGPVDDLLSPHEWSLVDRQIGMDGYGVTALPHLKDLVIKGPHDPTGISENAVRARVFVCRPASPAEERPCARTILAELAPKAYRRPVSDADLEPLLSFYDQGAAEGGFEIGVRTALQALLASPHFIFRFEEQPEGVKPGQIFRIGDFDLASRLSFFLWGTPPDEALLALAERGKLADRKVLEQQARRMLADPRSEALATRFAAQWLRLQDLDKIHPDRLMYPDFHQQLSDAMRRETELFFYDLVREDRSLLDFYTADYTFVNEMLARHYGIPGVTGDHFRKVRYPDDRRRGILGHGSVLTLTSVANRTSPVLRGKWVMEVLMGTPPPPPPPGVPALEDTEGVTEGRMLTTRERMEMHRASPACRSCHNFMDPIGLALDNYDVTGQWRIRENDMRLDTRGDFYDGTPVTSPGELNAALLRRPIPLVRTFTENLMAYALGRRVEYYDQPTVRSIARTAAEDEYRMSDFILGVVQSDAFRMKKAPESATTENSHPE